MHATHRIYFWTTARYFACGWRDQRIQRWLCAFWLCQLWWMSFTCTNQGPCSHVRWCYYSFFSTTNSAHFTEWYYVPRTAPYMLQHFMQQLFGWHANKCSAKIDRHYVHGRLQLSVSYGNDVPFCMTLGSYHPIKPLFISGSTEWLYKISLLVSWSEREKRVYMS